MANTQFSWRRFVPWVMWGLSALFYFYEFMLQVSPNVMVPELMRDFNISAQSVGSLAAAYFYVYAPMQIPVGVLLDRFGPRRLLIMATVVCAVAIYLFSQTGHLGTAYLARTLIGFGSAFAIIGCMKIVTNWFPERLFALMLGLIVSLGMMGAMAGEAPLAMLVNRYEWRGSLEILGIIGFLLAILMFLILRDKPKDPSLYPGVKINTQSNQPRSFRELGKGLLQVMRNKQIWLASIYGGLVFGSTSAFAGLWGGSFLSTAYGFSRTESAALVMFIFMGWTVGSPLFGWISDKIGRRRPPMIVGSLGALISFLIVLYVPHLPVSLIRLCLFSFGLFSSGFLLAFTVVKEITPPSSHATALGFINCLNMFPGAILQPLVGAVLDTLWIGTMHNNIRVYSVTDFQSALVILPITIAASLLILPFIQETYCKSAVIEKV